MQVRYALTKTRPIVVLNPDAKIRSPEGVKFEMEDWGKVKEKILSHYKGDTPEAFFAKQVVKKTEARMALNDRKLKAAEQSAKQEKAKSTEKQEEKIKPTEKQEATNEQADKKKGLLSNFKEK